MSKEEIKQQLRDYEPTPEETVVIKSAVLNFFSLSKWTFQFAPAP